MRAAVGGVVRGCTLRIQAALFLLSSLRKVHLLWLMTLKQGCCDLAACFGCIFAEEVHMEWLVTVKQACCNVFRRMVQADRDSLANECQGIF